MPTPIRPMRLLRIPQPFDHSDFILEPKLMDFARLRTSTGIAAHSFRATAIPSNPGRSCVRKWHPPVRCKSAVLDGEICCLGPDGRTNFNRLMFRREWPYLLAFDLLMLNGRDLRALPRRRLVGRQDPILLVALTDQVTRGRWSLTKTAWGGGVFRMHSRRRWM